MADQKEKSENPYVSPSSNLIDEFNVFREWDDFTIKCAENYCRSLFFGRVFAMCCFVFSRVLIDSALYGWEESFLNRPMTLGISVSCLLLVVFMIPGIKAFTHIQRLTNTVHKFLEEGREELQRRMVRPMGVAVFMLVFVLLIFLYEDVATSLSDSNPNWLTVRSLSLLVIPIMTPLAYLVARTARQKAENWLERMSEEL